MNIYILFKKKVNILINIILNMIRNAYVYIRKKVCACFHNRPGVMIYEPCRNFKIFYIYFCTVPIKHNI